ncbi:site-specific integrase [Seonamhaeicola sp.]|uniref:tyrosine-type recombinase/integrase n=1 Tax=Seonamhaeicola sp. TaxID=1912245 RepID=UPI00262EE84E|nr:site-specific integrase [Seonamhaeicola sp.]
MNLKYFIVKGKKKYLSIYVRFWDSKRVDQKTKTGIHVVYDDWSFKKQRIKVKPTSNNNADFLNSKLKRLEEYIINKYNLDNTSGNGITKTWLRDTVADCFQKVDRDDEYKVYFVSWVERFVDQAPGRLHKGRPIKPNSVKNYQGALNKLRSFESHSNKRYLFKDIDLKFHEEFIKFCRDADKLSENAIGNIIYRIRTFCSEIEMEGLPVSPQWRSKQFYAPKSETYDTYLNDHEIDAIFNHDFSHNEKLDNARDLFVIGLRTGLRVSDFLRVTSENILDNSVINITTTKTGQNLTIPIHPQFQSVLEKRNGQFPRKISEQKFNKYIKEVCKEVGLKAMTYGSKMNKKTKRKETKLFEKHELITSHCCRRSFASNLYAAGFDTSVIMKATGHKSETQFIKYIKLSQDEHIKKLSEYWENQNKSFG